MKSWLQFVTVPTADTPGTALYLHFDSKRYLIGRIGEGTQRACMQNGIAMRKAQDLLITGTCGTESTAGLIGMILTLADVVAGARLDADREKKVKKATKGFEPLGKSGDGEGLAQNGNDLFLSIYGPPNLNHSLATARRFVFRNAMPVQIHEMQEDELVKDESGRILPTWVDENIKVWAMAIKPTLVSGEESGERLQFRRARKRSFDEANGIEESSGSEPSENDGEQKRYDLLTRGVVASMFGSNWRMDTLTEMSLAEVQLPAKLWTRNKETRDLEEYTGPLPGGPEPLPDPVPKVLVRKPWPGALIASLPPTVPRKESISYIIQGHSRRGKFDPKAAERLGVKKGISFSKLTNGESIVTEQGQTITPDMVMGPTIPGNGIAVIDLPSIEYVEPLIKRPEWHTEEVMTGLGAVVWILGPGVAASPALRKFMEEKSNMDHIVSSPDHCPNQLAMDGAASMAIRLAQIDLAHFPIPHHDNTSIPQTSLQTFKDPVEALPRCVKIAQRGQVVQLEPKVELQNDKIIPPLDTLSLIQAENSQSVMDLARSARESFNQEEQEKEISKWISKLPMGDAEIITLGTGSALPSKYRNVSSNLVRVPGYGSYLLDAGENTLGQLQRVFKPSELIDILKDLRMIWISHLHADHHLGTVSVIKAWHQVVHGDNSSIPPVSPEILKHLKKDVGETAPEERPKYLAVVSDRNMLHYLSEFASVEDYGYEHVLPLSILPAELGAKVPSTLRLAHRDCPVIPILFNHYPVLLGIRNIQAVHVQHCHGAKAVAITFPFSPSSNETESDAERTKRPFKLSYSGDCRPSATFAAIGRGSTVLIHEATFEDELVGEARAKKHSTVKEALGVGSLMQAKAVVLTHFSQRYQKIPVLDKFWGDRGNIEAAIKGEDGQQERLAGIEADEDEIRGAVEDEGNEVVLPEMHTPEDEGAEIMEWTSTTTTSTASNSTAASTPKLDDMKVIIAFDYMRVKLRDMPKMEALRPALAKLFQSEIGNETRAKRGIDVESTNGDAKSKPTKKGKQERKKLSQVVKENLEAKRDEEVLKKATEGK